MYPLISIGSSLVIPTYLLVISLTYCAAVIWFTRRVQNSGMSMPFALDLSLVIMISGFLGARVFHIIYEAPSYYLQDPIRMLKVFEGGFVYYGGLIAALLGGIFFVKFKKENFYRWADLVAPVAAFGYAFGRLGCFLNGCCYGKVCELPWGISFKTVDMHLRHPTQLYSFFWDLSLCFIILIYENAKIRKTGNAFLIWIIGHTLGRFLIEQLRDDFRGVEPYGLSISSWISVALGLTFLLIALIRQSKKPSTS